MIYKLGNAQLSAVDSFTYLGVEITCDLRWNNHLSPVVTKTSNTLNFVRRNRYRCNGHVKELSYISLVRPQLEYTTAAWDPYTSCNIKDIEMVQRRAARYVKRDYQRTTSVTSLLDSLHWQSLQDRRRNARLLHI